MDCPKCKSSNWIRNGFVNEIQRYKCKECAYNYTVVQKSTAKPASERQLGLAMYLEGLGFRSISRVLNVSHSSVMKWVKKYGGQLEEKENEDQVSVVEMDELHSYVGQKKIIVGFGLQLTERGNVTLTSLLETEGRKRG